MDNFRIIILAAGEGKRMKADRPKVLVELNGKPLLHHLLESVAASGVDAGPIVVIAAGERGQMVKDATKDMSGEYVVQDKQKGTGHAVATAQSASGDASHVMVLYGDHPLVSPETIRRAAEAHQSSGSVITLMTATVPDFEDWRQNFKDFGRIVRDEKGNISSIVERKDSTSDQLKIKEVNPAYFCFNAKWLWESLPILTTKNAQGEYYLTDLVRMAFEQGRPIHSVPIDPKEALGVNSSEQLEIAKQVLTSK